MVSHRIDIQWQYFRSAPIAKSRFLARSSQFSALENFRQTALIQQRLIKLQVELRVAIEANFCHVLLVRSRAVSRRQRAVKGSADP